MITLLCIYDNSVTLPISLILSSWLCKSVVEGVSLAKWDSCSGIEYLSVQEQPELKGYFKPHYHPLLFRNPYCLNSNSLPTCFIECLIHYKQPGNLLLLSDFLAVEKLCSKCKNSSTSTSKGGLALSIRISLCFLGLLWAFRYLEKQ